MRVDIYPAKYDDYESGYDTISGSITKHPAVQLAFEEQTTYGVLIHKWQMVDKSNKGNYIACIDLKSNCLSSTYELFLTYYESNKNMFYDLENGVFPDDFSICVFKYSINQWRTVSKKRSKWEYTDTKPLKEGPCYIQRILLT